ncbi:MAG TPA: hypothetical protein VFR11_01710 [Micromonosporaceae bacterium]|nr:hypothetical protein [Micromonosporaceae bacterium]
MSTQPHADGTTSAEPVEPQVFRRRSTVIAGWVIAGLLVVLSVLLTVDEWDHGFFPAIAGPVTGLTLALLAVLLSVWPHVIVRDGWLEPHNSFVWYQVPYPAITEIGPVRMGLIVRTHGRKVIPLTGYASGFAGRMLGHQTAANEVVNAVEANMARHKRPGDEDAEVTRHWDARNAYALLAAAIVSAVVIVVAIQTYH